MRTTAGPSRITVVEVAPGRSLTVHRIVRTGEAEDPVLVTCLRSHYELGEEPRRVERSSTVIHMGISVYTEMRPAVETAKRWPRLGDYVARVRLEAGNGYGFAHTGPPLHLTLWGDPIKLAAAVVDIRAVGV